MSSPFTLIVNVSREFETISGIDDVNNIAFNIYPNPSNGVFNIELPELMEDVNVTVYDMRGQMITDYNVNQRTSDKMIVDLTGHATGAYMIKLETNGQVVTKRVMLK